MHSLLKKSTFYLVGLIFSKAINVFVFLFLARTFVPQLFGEFTLFITLIQFATYFADFGLVQWYIKKVVKIEERDDYFIKVLTLELLHLLSQLYLL